MRSLIRHVRSASGKTQLALQLALAVQLPVARHGLNGAACYLTISAGLPTPRLLELAQKHPALRGAANLAHVYTPETRSVKALLGVLSTALPLLIDRRPNARRVRLLVIDALADLFREKSKTTMTQLVVRSCALSDVSHSPSSYSTTSGGTLVRRLSLVFITALPPASADFIVASHGVEPLSEDMSGSFPDTRRVVPPARQHECARALGVATGRRRIARRCMCTGTISAAVAKPAEEPPVDADEKAYWRDARMDDVWDAVAQGVACWHSVLGTDDGLWSALSYDL
jgi:hypothetical protein